MKKILALIFVLVFSSCSNGANMNHSGDMSEMDHGEEMTSDTEAYTESLSDSPRHQEWVEIDNDGKTIHAFVVYPENKTKSSAVIMIHENKGLNDWARSMADQVAAEGYIVVAPDLLSSFDDEREMTSDFDSPDDATQALYTLDQQDIDSDLAAVSAYAQSIESYNGNLVSAGFCWGGAQSFNMAAQDDDLKASLVFYGTPPEDESAYSEIDIPVYGFYGENDERINSTIAATEENMSENGKIYEYEIYPGAGHAFMRNAQSDDADEPTIEARNNAFERMKNILSEYN
ncbi:dienelactone hydrolase family protein [Candidatus Gracilibacteria bacterium]|nr:dienelactone hydrolase family protein [Candidatus Gracilibacteria bacterium]